MRKGHGSYIDNSGSQPVGRDLFGGVSSNPFTGLPKTINSTSQITATQ